MKKSPFEQITAMGEFDELQFGSYCVRLTYARSNSAVYTVTVGNVFVTRCRTAWRAAQFISERWSRVTGDRI